MTPRIHIFRTPLPGGGSPRPDPLGCLLYSLGLIALGVLAAVILLPLLGIALGIGLGVVALGMIAVAYYRLRAWVRRKLGRRRDKYEAHVIDDPDNDEDGPGGGSSRPRLTVEVRRRPHRE